MAIASWTPNHGVETLDDGSHHHGAVTLGVRKRAVALEEHRNDRDVTQRPVARTHVVWYGCDRASSKIDV
jgi:hypothetical protein